MVIMMVNIVDAKAKLSELIDAAGRGEQVTICNRNEPVAELRSVAAARKTPRDLTAAFPDWTIDPAFFDPFEGEDLDGWYPDAAGTGSRVAERRATYAPRSRRQPRR